MSVWLSHAKLHLASLLEGLLEGSLSFASRNILFFFFSFWEGWIFITQVQR